MDISAKLWWLRITVRCRSRSVPSVRDVLWNGNEIWGNTVTQPLRSSEEVQQRKWDVPGRAWSWLSRLSDSLTGSTGYLENRQQHTHTHTLCVGGVWLWLAETHPHTGPSIKCQWGLFSKCRAALAVCMRHTADGAHHTHTTSLLLNCRSKNTPGSHNSSAEVMMGVLTVQMSMAVWATADQRKLCASTNQFQFSRVQTRTQRGS